MRRAGTNWQQHSAAASSSQQPAGLGGGDGRRRERRVSALGRARTRPCVRSVHSRCARGYPRWTCPVPGRTNAMGSPGRTQRSAAQRTGAWAGWVPGWVARAARQRGGDGREASRQARCISTRAVRSPPLTTRRRPRRGWRGSRAARSPASRSRAARPGQTPRGRAQRRARRLVGTATWLRARRAHRSTARPAPTGRRRAPGTAV
mmetsp:Transcript_17491/g.45199  ORF Transcript_17491/g.45199 Transcript_17491/m.45199 type:complete len:205 (+) Transcript_17491:520-1134(+)